MHIITKVFGLVLATQVSHASIFGPARPASCDLSLRQMFNLDVLTIPTLGDRLGLTNELSLEIHQNDMRRCPRCLGMGFSAGVLSRMPRGQFAAIFLHNLPDFRTTDHFELHAAFLHALAGLAPGGRLILTMVTPADWPRMNAQIAVARELGLVPRLLNLADLDLAGIELIKPN